VLGPQRQAHARGPASLGPYTHASFFFSKVNRTAIIFLKKIDNTSSIIALNSTIVMIEKQCFFFLTKKTIFNPFLIQNTFKTLFNQFMTLKNRPKTHNQSNLNSLHHTRPFDVKLDHFSYRNRRQ
jgi:hypothetical protein